MEYNNAKDVDVRETEMGRVLSNLASVAERLGENER